MLTAWQFAPLMDGTLGALTAAYLAGVWRVRRQHPHRPWPLRWTLAFLTGLAVIAVAVQSSAGAYDEVRFPRLLRGRAALGPSPLADLHNGGMVMWMGSDIVMIAVAVGLSVSIVVTRPRTAAPAPAARAGAGRQRRMTGATARSATGWTRARPAGCRPRAGSARAW